MGTNPLLTASDPLRGEQALRKLEFCVAIDLFMNPTAQLADLVLPAASWLEQDDVAEMHFIWCVLARKKLIEVGECWDDKKILIELARRMGMEDAFPWKDVRDYSGGSHLGIRGLEGLSLQGHPRGVSGLCVRAARGRAAVGH